MRCWQNKASINVYFQMILAQYWTTQKAIILQVVCCSSQMVQLYELKTPQEQLSPHVLNLQQSGGVGGGHAPKPYKSYLRGFMETSLISNEVFSDLLCLIRFVCNTWPFIYSVYFSSAFFFLQLLSTWRRFYFPFFWLPLFSKPHSDSFAESSHD